MNVALYIIVAAFWGGSFIAIKPLVEVMPPMYAAALRIAIAVLFLVIALPVLKAPLFIRSPIKKRIWLTGQFAFTLPFALLFWGEQRIAPGLAGILNG
ncbi:MAG: DMT family transporter, partial [Bdellovibrionaceae bacterium]|nr:DMT family transporter [Pseudobdellovibrionaceae bacterium]